MPPDDIDLSPLPTAAPAVDTAAIDTMSADPAAVDPAASDARPVDVAPAGADVVEPAPPPAWRAALAARLDAAPLTPAIREPLAAFLAAAPASDTPPAAPLDQVLDWLALAAPASLLLPVSAVAAEHPHGDEFFTGEPRFTDAAAAQLAAEQLAATGFGRRR